MTNVEEAVIHAVVLSDMTGVEEIEVRFHKRARLIEIHQMGSLVEINASDIDQLIVVLQTVRSQIDDEDPGLFSEAN